MLISEAKPLIGRIVDLVISDRAGKMTKKTAEIFDIGFVSLYGPCIITDQGDFRLDRVRGWEPSNQSQAA